MASSVVDLTKSDDDVVELSSRPLPEGLKRVKKKKKHHFPRDILNPEGASSAYRILKGRSSTVIEVSSGDDEALQGGTASRRVNLQRESKSPAGVRDNIPSGLDTKTQAGSSTSRKPIDGGGQSQPGGFPTPDPATSMANNSASDPPPVKPGSTEDISEKPVLRNLFSLLQTAQPIGKRRRTSPELGERTQTTTSSREDGATTTKVTEVANCVLDERKIEHTNSDVGGTAEETNELNNMRPKKSMGSSASSLQVEDPPSKPKAKEHLAKTARPVKSQATFPIRRAPRQSEESTHRSRNGSRSSSVHESEPPKEPEKEIARLRTSRSPLKNVSSISVATGDPAGNMDVTIGASPKAPDDHPEPLITEGITVEDTHFDSHSMKSHHMTRIYIFNQNGN
jgi:hypothetical protein